MTIEVTEEMIRAAIKKLPYMIGSEVKEIYEIMRALESPIVLPDMPNIDAALQGCASGLRQEILQLRLIAAHDRQAYPTAWAYQQVCKALENSRNNPVMRCARACAKHRGLPFNVAATNGRVEYYCPCCEAAK